MEDLTGARAPEEQDVPTGPWYPQPERLTVKLCDPGADGADEELPSSGLRVDAYGATDRGRRRLRNEDSYCVLHEHRVFAVADGMGGHVGGAEASLAAVEALREVLEEGDPIDRVFEELPPSSRRLILAVTRANEAVYVRSRAEPHLASMGTTLVALHIATSEPRLYVGHVGDSRCYRLRAGQFARLTTDHTMAEFGIVGPARAYLSRAVGIAPSVAIDVVCGVPMPGDVYLLCSDGLNKMVEDSLIHDTLTALGSCPKDAADELIAIALARGGRDNVTVIVVRILADDA